MIVVKSNKKRRRIIIACAVILLISSAILTFYWNKNQSNFKIEPAVYGQEIKKPTIVSASSRLLIVGDVFWGRQYERKRLNNEPNAIQFPFSGLASYDKAKYNSWIADVECPITDRNIDFQTQWDAIALNCRPEFTSEFAKWFDIATLANNHMYDIDQEVGYESTTANLDKNNIQYFGHYLASKHDKACKVITVGIDLKYSDNTNKKSKLPLAMCGYHGVISIPTPEDIAEISKYSDKFITIVMPHMGVEYQAKADGIKTTTYRAMVDAGADLIAGGHPHWVQNTEVYKNKLIVYSLGNFIFDQQGSNDVQRSIALDATMEFSSPEQINILEKWLALSGDCMNIASCSNEKLANVSKAVSLPKINYDLIVGQQKGLVQAKSTDIATINQVLTRASWASTKANLGQ